MNRTIFLLILWHIAFFLPIMGTIEAQGTRLIVDSSSFEMISVRDPFTPQVPQEDVRMQQVEPVKIEKPVIAPPLPRMEESSVGMPGPQNIERPPTPETPLPGLNVSGLVWNTVRPQAIINGQIVGIGDTVLGVKIVDIQKAGIAVLFNEKTKILEVAP